jgi:hypothetical protein
MATTKDEGFTLTKATKFGRGFVKWGSIFLVVMMVGRITLAAAVAYWKATHPPPPPEPTRGFGKLPDIEFGTVVEKPVSYKLELPTNKFPTFGDRAIVYFMPKNSPGLLDTDIAKDKARRLGFLSEPQTLNAQTLRWSRSQTLNITLEMDVISHNFEYSTDFMAHPELILQSQIPTAFDAVRQVKSFLDSPDLLPADVSTASGKVTYLRAVGGELQPAVSVSEAQFIQVDLNRADLSGKYPVYTADGETGTIHAILASGLAGNGIVELIRNYWPVDYTLTHTYYLRSPESAWSILQAGDGYVAKPGDQDEAVIRDVTLGYFEGEEPQMYLQPIYVFMGDGGFLGYVPALSPNQQGPSQ